MRSWRNARRNPLGAPFTRISCNYYRVGAPFLGPADTRFASDFLLESRRMSLNGAAAKPPADILERPLFPPRRKFRSSSERDIKKVPLKIPLLSLCHENEKRSPRPLSILIQPRPKQHEGAVVYSWYFVK